ncbi:MAG: ABC transporter ATP-binding protein [Lachnospiraceae bacterium]|nr:ABC transporter ATP-binding protein [Lachnospiraceae bacterium]
MELIRMEQITKIYPGTIALDHVDFSLNEQEIVSLLGENGAGKTTLMKILYGMTAPTSGSIFFKGEPLKLKKPADAIEKGICMVHQHFMLVPAFTVTENIILGNEPGTGAFLSMKEARHKVERLIQQFHFNLDPDAKIEKLSVGEQQRVEILKVLYRKAEVIILDEPTAVLTPHEVNDLFAILQALREEGKTIIIITHKLKETKALADRVVVLRDGKLIQSDINPKKVTTQQLSEMMVGRQVNLSKRQPAANIGNICLCLKDLVVKEGGKERIKGISFEIHHGEILGIAGIEGNGQTQLIEALTGMCVPKRMELTVEDQAVKGDCKDFLEAGIGHIPEDRLSLGLVKEMTVKDNLILGYHRKKEFCSKGGFRLEKKILDRGNRLKQQFAIKAPNIGAAASSLSGGNQQKIIIARVFSQNPNVIIIAHPTRGVDIGAMEYIHQVMLNLRDQGAAILLISADLDEVRTLSDRLLVLYEGKIVSESLPGELSEVEMGLLMTGGHTMIEEGSHG